MAEYKKDKRSAKDFLPYHRFTRKNVPWAQTLLMLFIVPILSLMSRLKIEGRENIPDGGYIVAGNHHSYFDPLFVALAIRRRIRFMGKSDLFKKSNGFWLSLLGGFPVRRGIWDTDAFETAEAVINKKRVMAIFPEGGISMPGKYKEPKPGIGYLAQRTGALVLPIYLDGARKLYKPWTWPKVSIVIGRPISFPQNLEPTPENNQQVADEIFAVICAMGER